MSPSADGGSIIADVLAERGVRFLFSLCGGHISPILVGAKRRGLRVVDVRDEASAVFAADAVARISGVPGVAAVTAGPGVTNTITAVKNAQMAQTPLVIFGGATATLLEGRGSLQDIDQQSLMSSVTKWTTKVKTLANLAPTVERAFKVATSGVPGPVFVEVPVDLLYPEAIVRDWTMKESGVEAASGLAGKALALYLRGHLFRQFHAPRTAYSLSSSVAPSLPWQGPDTQVAAAAEALARAQRPVLVIGSQALTSCRDPGALIAAVEHLGIPTYLAGMARGLLGRRHPLQLRHKRSAALRQADVVVVAGFPFDFRLGYGRSIGAKATVIAANLSSTELSKNRKPQIAAVMHPAEFLESLAAVVEPVARDDWFGVLRDREVGRDAEIVASASATEPGLVDPVSLFLRLEEKMADDAVLVVDGGDFVATASYIVRPRQPLSWLDPGVFGTLGVGGGFAIGATLCHPGKQTWLLYGDGSSAYSLAEFDTFARHGLAPIAIIGTDGAWAQIARDQREMLGDDVGTVLRRTPYHRVAEGYGGVGLLLDDPAAIDTTLDTAIEHASAGRPVCINVHIAATDFRKGSISM